MINISHLQVTYPDLVALEDFTLNIKNAGLVGIIGPNGAGKSTLLKAILNMLPHEGQITIDNKDSKKYLKNIAYVEQKANIDFDFPITVRECVSLGLYPHLSLFQHFKKSDWEKVDNALALVGLEELGYRQISQLSGGQFQRVLMARCLVQKADYIFLDEPFVGIDTVSEEILMKNLRQLKKNGKTILIIHHDLNKVNDYFDQVMLINHRLIAFGPTDRTFTKENLAKTFGQQLFFAGGVNK